MARIPRIFDLIKQGKRINEVDEVIPKSKYPFGNLIIKNDDEIRASTDAYRKQLEIDNDITRSMSGLEDTKITKEVDSSNESNIVSFTDKKETKKSKEVYTGLMSEISEKASNQGELVRQLEEAGTYGVYQKGVRVKSRNHLGDDLPPYEITGLSLNKVKLNSPDLKQTEERLGIKFNYIEKDGTYYLPMLNTKTAEGLHTQVYLDALKQRDIPIMDGPTGLMSKQ
tara:strand:+ start:57 stop:734 length:678 start_codon:yes stop_codon:yes gene_type:complete